MWFERPLGSLPPVQGVGPWTAVHAVWPFRCDAQFRCPEKGQKGYMAVWHVILQDGGEREEVSAGKDQIRRVRQPFGWRRHGGSDKWKSQGIREYEASKKRRRKEEANQQVLCDWVLEAEPRKVRSEHGPMGQSRKGWMESNMQGMGCGLAYGIN